MDIQTSVTEGTKSLTCMDLYSFKGAMNYSIITTFLILVLVCKTILVPSLAQANFPFDATQLNILV